MNQAATFHRSRPLVPVCDTAELEFLIKESEIVTGIAGRTFVVLGSRLQSYRIALRPSGYLLRSQDGEAMAAGTRYVSAADWPAHPVSRALQAGLLFTFEVDR